jgi:hypothetical protein
MVCTRQRCQVACSTLATAAFSPSCASEIVSLTPRNPRRARDAGARSRRSRLRGADRHPEHLAAAIVVDTDGDDHSD